MCLLYTCKLSLRSMKNLLNLHVTKKNTDFVSKVKAVYLYFLSLSECAMCYSFWCCFSMLLKNAGHHFVVCFSCNHKEK